MIGLALLLLLFLFSLLLFIRVYNKKDNKTVTFVLLSIRARADSVTTFLYIYFLSYVYSVIKINSTLSTMQDSINLLFLFSTDHFSRWLEEKRCNHNLFCFGREIEMANGNL